MSDVLAWLKRRGSKRNRDGMQRYAILAPKALGVSVGTVRALGQRLGTDRDLATPAAKRRLAARSARA